MEQIMCLEHGVMAKKNQWGKYAHMNGKDATGKTLWCNKTAEQIGLVEGSLPPKVPVIGGYEDPKVNSMYACNAMNNAVALVNGGKVDILKLDSAYKRILNILEGKNQQTEDLDNWPDSQ